VSEHTHDPTVLRIRDEISGLDRAILDAVNARLELVSQLRRHKASKGIPFLDPEREQQLLDELLAANAGPLSEQGLRQLVAEILDLTKREVSRDRGTTRPTS